MTGELLKEHFSKYPGMELQDAVKLLYQSEFGGGHMIADPEASLRRLEEEYGTFHEGSQISEIKPGEKILWEPAGKGMARIYLDAMDAGLSARTLNAMFVRSAETAAGKPEAFQESLEELAALCRAGTLPFSGEEAEQYIREYRGMGCPVLSHSRTYRELYHPAYRIVDRRYAQYLEVFLQIDRLLAEGGSTGQINAAVDGMCGSGKTTLAGLLSGVYDCNIFHMDDYFLQPFQRTEKRLLEAGGNVDYKRFQEEVLSHLKDPGGLNYRIYDCGRQRLTDLTHTDYSRINIVEGAYSQHPYFGDFYDLRVFLEIPGDEQRRRILERNGEFMFRRFVSEWIPMENKYFQAYGIREKSLCLKG